MVQTTRALDREWQREYEQSVEGTAALHRWVLTDSALRGLETLGDVLEARKDPERAQPILAAVARHAPHDRYAARTLLQALLPGLVELALRGFRDNPSAFEEVVALAWQRICNYPTTRNGSVAGNVVLDVRKDYLAEQKAAAPIQEILSAVPTAGVWSPSAEDVVMASSILQEMAEAAETGVISRRAHDVIIRTRYGDETLDEVAGDHDTTTRNAQCIRWRAELKLRDFLPTAA